MNCTNCNRPLGAEDLFCQGCGAPRPEQAQLASMPPEQAMMPNMAPPVSVQCVNCGAPLPPGAGFCGNCGVTQPVAPMAPPKKKKNKALVAVIISVLVVGLLVGGFFGGRQIYWSMQYDKAAEAMQTGDYLQAQELFQSLPEDYEDASSQAYLCGQHIQYNDAQALMDAGNYEAAQTAFTALGGFQDASAKAETCGDTLDYNEAMSYYSAGEYYTAYQLFTALGSFQDSSAMASACVQPFPASAVTYRNASFTGSACTFSVENNNSYRLYKMYTVDGELMMTIFTNPYDSVTVDIPAGTYKINMATGSQWFGDEDMFGTGGNYMKYIFDLDTNEDSYYFGENRMITIYFGDGTGADLYTDPVSMDNF